MILVTGGVGFIGANAESHYVTDRPGHDRQYAIDARKLERELGWKPAETFETGIRKTVRWYLDNPAWVARVWVEVNYGDRTRA